MHCQLSITFAAGLATLRLPEDLKPVDQDPELCARIADALDAGCRRLEVDGTRVRRIDPSAMAALAAARADLEARGGSLVVTGCSAAFGRAASKAGLTELLEGTSEDPRP